MISFKILVFAAVVAVALSHHIHHGGLVQATVGHSNHHETRSNGGGGLVRVYSSVSGEGEEEGEGSGSEVNYDSDGDSEEERGRRRVVIISRGSSGNDYRGVSGKHEKVRVNSFGNLKRNALYSIGFLSQGIKEEHRASSIFRHLATRPQATCVEDVLNVYLTGAFGAGEIIDSWVPGLGRLFSSVAVASAKINFCLGDGSTTARSNRPGTICSNKYGSNWGFKAEREISTYNSAKDYITAYGLDDGLAKCRRLLSIHAKVDLSSLSGSQRVVAQAIFDLFQNGRFSNNYSWSKNDVSFVFSKVITVLAALGSSYHRDVGDIIIDDLCDYSNVIGNDNNGLRLSVWKDDIRKSIFNINSNKWKNVNKKCSDDDYHNIVRGQVRDEDDSEESSSGPNTLPQNKRRRNTPKDNGNDEIGDDSDRIDDDNDDTVDIDKEKNVNINRQVNVNIEKKKYNIDRGNNEDKKNIDDEDIDKKKRVIDDDDDDDDIETRNRNANSDKKDKKKNINIDRKDDDSRDINDYTKNNNKRNVSDDDDDTNQGDKDGKDDIQSGSPKKTTTKDTDKTKNPKVKKPTQKPLLSFRIFWGGIKGDHIASKIFRNLSKKPKPTKVGDVLDVYLTGAFGAGAIIDSWAPGLGKLFSSLAVVSTKINYCSNNGPFKVPSSHLGSICTDKYGSKWGFKPIRQISTSSKPRDYISAYGLDDGLDKFRILLKTHVKADLSSLSGSQRIVAQAIYDSLQNGRFNADYTWSKKDVSFVFSKVITVLAALGSSYHKNVGPTIVDNLCDYSRDIGNDSNGLDLISLKNEIKKAIVSANSHRWQQVIKECSDEQYYKIVQNQDKNDDDDDDDEAEDFSRGQEGFDSTRDDDDDKRGGDSNSGNNKNIKDGNDKKKDVKNYNDNNKQNKGDKKGTNNDDSTSENKKNNANGNDKKKDLKNDNDSNKLNKGDKKGTNDEDSTSENKKNNANGNDKKKDVKNDKKDSNQQNKDDKDDIDKNSPVDRDTTDRKVTPENNKPTDRKGKRKPLLAFSIFYRGIKRDHGASSIFKSLSKKPKPTQVGDVLDVYLTGAFGAGAIIDSWAPGLGKLFSSLAVVSAKINYCSNNGPFKVSSSSLGSICTDKYGSNWGFKPDREVPTSNKPSDYIIAYGLDDGLAKFRTLLKTHVKVDLSSLSGSQKIVAQAIFDILQNGRFNADYSWSKKDVSFVFSKVITVLATLGSSYHKNVGLTIVDNLCDYSSDIGNDSNGLDLFSLKNDIKKVIVSANSHRWQQVINECSDDQYNKIVQTQNDDDDDDDDDSDLRNNKDNSENNDKKKDAQNYKDINKQNKGDTGSTNKDSSRVNVNDDDDNSTSINNNKNARDNDKKEVAQNDKYNSKQNKGDKVSTNKDSSRGNDNDDDSTSINKNTKDNDKKKDLNNDKKDGNKQNKDDKDNTTKKSPVDEDTTDKKVTPENNRKPDSKDNKLALSSFGIFWPRIKGGHRASAIFKTLSTKPKSTKVSDVLDVYLTGTFGAGAIIDSWVPGLGKLFSSLVLASTKINYCLKNSVFRDLSSKLGSICSNEYGSDWGFKVEKEISSYNDVSDYITAYGVGDGLVTFKRLLKTHAKSDLSGLVGSQKVVAQAIFDIFDSGRFSNDYTWTKKDVTFVFSKVITVLGALGSSYDSKFGPSLVDELLDYSNDIGNDSNGLVLIDLRQNIKKSITACQSHSWNNVIIFSSDEKTEESLNPSTRDSGSKGRDFNGSEEPSDTDSKRNSNGRSSSFEQSSQARADSASQDGSSYSRSKNNNGSEERASGNQGHRQSNQSENNNFESGTRNEDGSGDYEKKTSNKNASKEDAFKNEHKSVKNEDGSEFEEQSSSQSSHSSSSSSSSESKKSYY